MLRQAVVLVGGLGTRLGALTADTPKPMLPVGGTPFLDYLLRNLARHGFNDILLLARHQAQKIHAHYTETQIPGARIRVLEESAPAGTGGALREAAPYLDKTFLLTNGDSVFDFNYLALLETFRRTNATVSLGLCAVPDVARYGQVSLNETGQVVRYAEKSAPVGTPGHISGGVYIVSRSILEAIPGGQVSLETDVMPGLVASGRVSGAVFEGYFLDIGLPESYALAQEEIPTWEQRRVVFFDRDVTLNKDDGYTLNLDNLVFLPHVPEAIRRCNDAGRLVIVLTNQAGVAQGHYGQAEIDALHQEMNLRLQVYGAHIDGFYHSAHHPEDRIAELPYVSDGHKPSTGLFHQACSDWNIDLADAAMIGDKQSDLTAAEAFGIRGLLTNGTNLADIIESLDV